MSKKPRAPRRSRAHCDCGGPCFYCGRALGQNRHEHDHFPIPWRHGGEATVPACRECHSLKDRCRPLGLRRDGDVDLPVWRAIEAGMSELPPIIVATGERVPFMLSLLYELIGKWREVGHADWNGDGGLVEDVEAVAGHIEWSIERCTTPEAKIWLARKFAQWLDAIDAALLRRDESYSLGQKGLAV